MKVRRILIDLTVIFLALVTFAVWYQNCIIQPASTLSTSRKYKIYLITTDKEYQYWEFLNQGAADMANSMGIVDYIWDAPVIRGAQEQIQVINNAVEQGADALLVAADDPKRISAVIEDAKAKSVRIVYVDSPAYEEAIVTLATDNYEAGIMAGRAMLSNLNKYGIQEGTIGIISVADKSNTDLREQGFRRTMEEDGRFMLLDTVYTDGEPESAQAAAQRIMMENSDLVALLGTNEGTSRGVGYAIKENNNKYIGIGFDRTDAMLQLLEDGNLKAIVEQNPYTMGYLGMAEAVAALLGKDTGPDYINTGVSVIESNR